LKNLIIGRLSLVSIGMTAYHPGHQSTATNMRYRRVLVLPSTI